MSNPLVTGRRVALQIVLLQFVVALAVAALTIPVAGVDAGLGVLSGGLAVVLGIAGMAHLALGGGIGSARLGLLRLLAGVLGKWLLIAVVVWLAIARWALPPLATIAGLAIGLLAFPLMARWAQPGLTRHKRGMTSNNSDGKVVRER